MTTLSDQLISSLDMISEENEDKPKTTVKPSSIISASQQLLDYRKRTSMKLGNFVPLTSSSNNKNNHDSTSYINQIAMSNVPVAKYWKSHNNKTNRSTKAFKATIPNSKKQLAKKKKGEEYNDRLHAKASKALKKQQRRKNS